MTPHPPRFVQPSPTPRQGRARRADAACAASCPRHGDAHGGSSRKTDLRPNRRARYHGSCARSTEVDFRPPVRPLGRPLDRRHDEAITTSPWS